MSSVLRPVGPESAGTYWLRRVLLIAVLVVVIVVVAHECGGGGAAGPSAGSRSTVTPSTPTASPPVTHHPQRCRAAQLALTLATDSPTYRVGQTPKFTATIRNTGTAACRLNAGPSHEVWTVTSGKDRIWSTEGCVQSHGLRLITLKRHATHLISVFWDGRRRSAGCVTGPPATPGTYVLSAVVDGLQAASVPFRLTS